MAQQSLKRTAGGLATNPNALSEVPEGALSVAQNCVIDSEGIIEKRRGFKRYGTTLNAKALMEFENALVGLEGSTLKYDPDAMGNWTPWAGSFSPPVSDARMRGIESQGTFYLTSATGIKRTDLLTTSPVAAGIPSALDLTLTPSGIGGSWFLPDTEVAYRVLWGRVDANARLMLSAPSMREVAINTKSGTLNWTRSGTGPWTVTVTHTAHGFATNDIVEVLSSTASALVAPWVITVVDANTYTFSSAVDPGASGTLVDGKKLDVTLVFPVPDDIVDGDFYEIYRTALSGSAVSAPTDRELKVIRYALSAAIVTMTYAAGVVTVTQTAHGFATGSVVRMLNLSDPLYEDGRHIITNTGANTYTYTVVGVPPATGTGKTMLMQVTIIDNWSLSLGDELYTNLTQETIDQANARPPWARDMAFFREFMHYAGTRKEHFLELQLFDIAGLVDNTSSITITQGAVSKTYTFSTAEDLANRKFQRSTAGTLLAVQLEKTIKSLTRIINRDPTNLWYAWYTSGINDAPGIFVIESRTLNTVPFTLTCNNATTSSKFSPNLPTSGTLLTSENEDGVNRLYEAKVEQPESVPELNWDPVGDESRSILRLLGTRDSLMIIKEDGIWRKSGLVREQFTIRIVDSTVFCVAPETWVTGDNAIYGLTQNGIVRATESGTTLISWPINDIFLTLQTFPGFETISHAIFHQADFRYVFFCQEFSTDTTATVAWTYNTLTKKWTGPWRKPVQAAHVLFKAKRLYLSHGLDSWVLEERRTFAADLSDYSDEELPVTCSVVSTTFDADGNTVTQITLTGYTHSAKPETGWLYQKDPSALPPTVITAVENPQPGQYLLTLEGLLPGLAPGTGKVFVGISEKIIWVPEAAGNAAQLKHFQNIQLYLREGTSLHNRISFSSDIDTAEFFVGEIKFDQSIGGVMIREIVPTQHQRCRALILTYENRIAKENAAIIQAAYGVRLTGERTVGGRNK